MQQFALSPEEIHHAGGQCWTIRLPADVPPGDSSGAPTRSTLRVFEDGNALGPAHAEHVRIRTVGRGLFSHWQDHLYFSTSDSSDPTRPEHRYFVEFDPAVAGVTETAETDDGPPSLAEVAERLRRTSKFGSIDLLHEPEGSPEARIKSLEAKVDYLLDELYSAKSQLRMLTPASPLTASLRQYQLDTFDFQWKHLPYHDAFLTNPEWRDKAPVDICHRLEKEPEWFKGKRILDCGCGPGRHAWALSTLGAKVTAFDMSENGLADARKACADFPETTIERRNILEPLPYPADFDVVWCYGVIHHTGDTFRALSNIAGRVRPGGLLYFMVYAEPNRADSGAYRYFHEIYSLRQLTAGLPFEEKAQFFCDAYGDRYALGRFDAISSVINDLYTLEEMSEFLRFLGFGDVKRTAMDEANLNVVATRHSGS